MEKWDRTVIDINMTVDKLGDKSGLLLGLHAMSGCYTVSYPYGKGKISAVELLESRSLSGLNTSLGETNVSVYTLQEMGSSFFLALYGQEKTKPSNCKIQNIQKKEETT